MSESKVRSHHRNRAKARCNRRLPTPPPDPLASQEILEQPGSPTTQDIHFFEYINSLPKSPHHVARSDSLFAPALGTEDAFDHLEKLYKLMEQMLNLRQQNAKLERRVRDLQHLKSLHRIDLVNLVENIPEVDDDDVFAESLLDTMLMGSKKEFVKAKPWPGSRLRQSLMKKNPNRRFSLNDRMEESDEVHNRRGSSGSRREKSAKVSKWTKVKAAFRWEKAAPSVSGAKSQDSGIGGMLPVNYEVARYLRVPSASEDAAVSPADSGAADGSTPGTLSSASSNDDIQHHEHPESQRVDFQTVNDDTNSFPDVQLFRKNDAKSAWSKTQNTNSWDKENLHRLSTRSDDTKMSLSDNESVEEENGSQAGEKSRKNRARQEIPRAVIEKYHKAILEDEQKNKTNSLPKRASKWTRVKKAFLTPTSNNLDKYKNNNAQINLHNEFHPHKSNNESKKIREEIHRNYRQLQKKLSLEFQDKLKEWDKLKSNPSTVSGAKNDNANDEQKDQAFIKKMEEWERLKSQPSKSGQSIPMIREENLAPEFKKKLEEWQKIKKTSVKDDNVAAAKTKKKLGEWPKWKSVSGQREESGQNEVQPLSDDFLKKLEEWRKIKGENKHYDTKEKTPSPKISRKEETSTEQPKVDKDYTQHELHWFENELNHIEKEKQRLENERQTFLQREERLTKLRRAVLGNGDKKDVLIHTPSGFYKFEGISRKFTQKLCEWEEARGIGPEASTFALLTSKFTPRITVDLPETDYEVSASKHSGSKLLRSKSAESVAISTTIQPCTSASHHPSSLSLNDVEELERQCLLSRDSSTQDLGSLENFEEPEAVIVEVEDVVEETASPLAERLEEKHFAIYQREMVLNTCEEKSLVVPCIQRDSKRAQYSYFLIEEIVKIIKMIDNKENQSRDEINQRENIIDAQIQRFDDQKNIQQQRSNIVLEKLIRLQEIHGENITGVALGFGHSSNHFSNLLEAAQDSFSELMQMAEQLQTLFYNRCYESSVKFSDSSYSDVTATTSELIAKLSELKRILTYFYATSDMTAPGRKINRAKNDYPNQKRMRYKAKDCVSKTMHRNGVGEKCTLQKHEVVSVDSGIVQKLVIPTKSNLLDGYSSSSVSKPVEVFVKTTRKLFTPVAGIAVADTEIPQIPEQNSPSYLPPSQGSPTPQRKASKEISPSIRIMLAKYNQMISGQEPTTSTRSTGSSGSASPVAWRSPVSERRVKAQRERYLQEITKIGTRTEVKKSASVNILTVEKQVDLIHISNSGKKCLDIDYNNRGILRSTSASVIPAKSGKTEEPTHQLKLVIPQPNATAANSPSDRLSQLHKAKEQFLNSPTTPTQAPSSAPPDLSVEQFPSRNRFSQISMGSESSYESSACGGFLVKSASAGMIHVDPDIYDAIDPAIHLDGYVSLPRSVQKPKEGFLGGKLALSNIAAKFRKVRMRRSKDQKKMNTISALCKQSLTVDINSGQESEERTSRRASLVVPFDNRASSSDDASQSSSSRSGSWMRKSRIFKAL